MQYADLLWWKAPSGVAYEKVFSYVDSLEQQQYYRSQEFLNYARLYGSQASLGFSPSSYTRMSNENRSRYKLSFNIISSMCDTATSKITKNKPRPFFLTDSGSFEMQTRAKKLNKFVMGQFYQTKIYDIMPKVFLDSCIFGTGFLKIFRDGPNIRCERVLPHEVVVDDVEAIHGSPRQLHQIKYVHKDVLIERYPGFKKEIQSAGLINNNAATVFENPQNDKTLMVRVIESWHLPSASEAKDGKHIISIDTATLMEEDYTRSYFPFVKLTWTPKLLGYFGKGISESIQDIQFEINKILRIIQMSMELTCIPKWFVEAGSKIVKSHLSNKIGGIVTYAGTPPQLQDLGAVSPALFSHLDRLYARAFEQVGVSQLSAQSAKPAGLNSGKALREYNDIESERFMSVAKEYESAFLEASRQMINLAKEINEKYDDYTVKVPGSKFLETIKWADIDLEDDMYMMQCFPTSNLPTTPAGRLQYVQELTQAGFLSQEEALKLLDFPDIQKYVDRKNAPIEDIENMIDRMMEYNEYEPPEPYQNLALGIEMCKQAYLRYKNQGVEDDRLELLRNWITDADESIKQATQETVTASESQATLARPEALPTSDLIPQV